MLENKDTAKIFPLTPCASPGGCSLHIIHEPLGNEQQLLVVQDHYVSQYMYIQQLVHLTPERIVQLYEVFQDDMPGDLHQLQNEVGGWKTR